MKLRIAEIIEEKGKKKSFIAKEIGISPSSLTRYLKGYVCPNAKVLKKLADVLEVSVNDFFLDSKNTNTYDK